MSCCIRSIVDVGDIITNITDDKYNPSASSLVPLKVVLPFLLCGSENKSSFLTGKTMQVAEEPINLC